MFRNLTQGILSREWDECVLQQISKDMDVSTFLIKDPLCLFGGLRRYSKLSPDNVYVDRQFQRRIFEVAAEYSITRPVKASVSFYDRVPSKPIDRTRFYTPFDMTAMVSHRLDDLSNSPSPGPIQVTFVRENAPLFSNAVPGRLRSYFQQDRYKSETVNDRTRFSDSRSVCPRLSNRTIARTCFPSGHAHVSLVLLAPSSFLSFASLSVSSFKPAEVIAFSARGTSFSQCNVCNVYRLYMSRGYLNSWRTNLSCTYRTFYRKRFEVSLTLRWDTTVSLFHRYIDKIRNQSENLCRNYKISLHACILYEKLVQHETTVLNIR